MNWDSGLGFERWHQGKKLGLTQEALIGLASSDSLLPGKQWGRWAKTMLDNGFDFYDRAGRALAGRRSPDPRALRRHARCPQGVGSARLAAGAHAGQRRPRDRRRPRQEAPAPSRRRCTPTTPTSAASP